MTTHVDRPRWLDNVIPLRPDLAGTQTAGWTPGPPAQSGLGCRVFADRMIPVADGVALAADVCMPARPGRYPAVVLFSAYSHQLQPTGAPTGTNETGEPVVFTDRGYAHVVVSRRGMGRSQGDSVAFFSESDTDDHVAVIDWVSRQPWCNGDVVLFGTSYYGVVQPLVAARRPPALKAFFALGIDTDYFRHILMFGGAPQIDFLTLWMGANFTEAQQKLHVPPVLRAGLSQVFNSSLKRTWQPAMQKRMAAMMDSFKKKEPARKYRQLFAEMALDGKTRATSPMQEGPRADLGKIDVPFVVVHDTGAFNLHQFGAYDLMQNAGTPDDRKWLIMTPPEYALPVHGWQLEALAFFDHIVHGTANGYAEQPPVRYQADGTPENEYRAAPAFPIPGSTPVRYHLAYGGGNTHRLTPTSPAAGSSSWAAVPFGAVTPPGLDEVAPPVLTFDTVIDGDTEFAGPITLSLEFSSNEIDSHVIARLGRVDRDGVYHLLSMGSIRPACRRVDTERSTATEIAIDIDRPQPLTPGEPVTLTFSLTPRPALLRTGETLRLDIASRTDILRSDVSHGFQQFDMQVPPYFPRNTLHFGQHSYIELSTINNESA